MILSCSCSAESRATSPTSGFSTGTVGARFCTLPYTQKQNHAKVLYRKRRNKQQLNVTSFHSPRLRQEILDALHLPMAVLLLLWTERLLRLKLHVALRDQHLLGFGELREKSNQSEASKQNSSAASCKHDCLNKWLC